MSDIEYKDTDEVVCPYCGYEFGDSWELDINYNSVRLDCNECNREFECSAENTRTYSSAKLDCVGKHKMKLNLAYIKDEETITNKELPLEEFEYTESFHCENCEEMSWEKLTKEEFKNKYPDKFKITMNHYAKRGNDDE